MSKIKVLQRIKLQIGAFSEPDARFTYINVDFIILLLFSDGYQYCMTIIDRFARRPEVLPTVRHDYRLNCSCIDTQLDI